ncbi:transglutaminase family protein [Streptomyces sp. CAU 1734]|uniref:transglutaminase-like domain-containing protein n=1 Tax=Streptomyces sp. CAU 1734 TaxID=3140360 RepID=UPI003260D0F2
MITMQQEADDSAYLADCDVIDHHHPLVRETAAELRASSGGDAYAYAEAAFGYVRDTIPHSHDSGDPRVTWRASDVLRLRTGICFAKAHALTALLRAEAVPAALCYQKLEVVHGLVAVRLPGRAEWARQDPRGNKPGVDARFSLDGERLAFPVDREAGEMDYPVLYAAPHPRILAVLRSSADREALWARLPTEL